MFVSLTFATTSSAPSDTGFTRLGTFCDNGTIYFGCDGKNNTNNFFICPVSSDITDTSNWTTFDTDTVMNNLRVRGMSWIPQMNEFCLGQTRDNCSGLTLQEIPGDFNV